MKMSFGVVVAIFEFYSKILVKVLVLCISPSFKACMDYLGYTLRVTICSAFLYVESVDGRVK